MALEYAVRFRRGCQCGLVGDCLGHALRHWRAFTLSPRPIAPRLIWAAVGFEVVKHYSIAGLDINTDALEVGQDVPRVAIELDSAVLRSTVVPETQGRCADLQL